MSLYVPNHSSVGSWSGQWSRSSRTCSDAAKKFSKKENAERGRMDSALPSTVNSRSKPWKTIQYEHSDISNELAWNSKRVYNHLKRISMKFTKIFSVFCASCNQSARHCGKACPRRSLWQCRALGSSLEELSGEYDNFESSSGHWGPCLTWKKWQRLGQPSHTRTKLRCWSCPQVIN